MHACSAHRRGGRDGAKTYVGFCRRGTGGVCRARTGAPAAVLGTLRQWAASLPWVLELPPVGRGDPVRFEVDCPPLGRRGAWLLLDQTGGPGFPPAIFVVLADTLARRGIATGWAAPIGDLCDGQQLVAVATPSTMAEARALRALLVVAYTALCSGPGPADQP